MKDQIKQNSKNKKTSSRPFFPKQATAKATHAQLEQIKNQAFQKLHNAHQIISEADTIRDKFGYERWLHLAREIISPEIRSLHEVTEGIEKLMGALAMDPIFVNKKETAPEAEHEVYLAGDYGHIHLEPLFFNYSPETQVSALIQEVEKISGLKHFYDAEASHFFQSVNTNETPQGWSEYVNCLLQLPTEEPKIVETSPYNYLETLVPEEPVEGEDENHGNDDAGDENNINTLRTRSADAPIVTEPEVLAAPPNPSTLFRRLSVGISRFIPNRKK